jgi:MtN3 and saliva related transmembrane protein|tara:strand:+ start:104 stop:367 length:264 start_codon:yes stop_codon:yes gene_type:complete
MIKEFIINYVGFFAAFCTTISFLPQVIKVYKTKSTKDISLYMFLIFTIGTFCWLIYGILESSLPIIIANTITLILSATILLYKIKLK